MLSSTILVFSSVCTLAAIVAIVRRFGGKRRHHFPPGPKGLPIVGNLFDVPTNFGWYTFAKWAQQYNSDVIHFEVLGKHFYVLHSAALAKELFERRSQTYSDRQLSVMACELTGWHRVLTLTPYGEYWRQYRRLFHEHFRAQVIPQYEDKMLTSARNLLRLLLETPDKFLRHIRHASGRTMLDIVYALDTEAHNNAVILESVEKAIEIFAEVAEGGAYLVDHLPILKYLPAWFPGAGFKRQAAAWRVHVDTMYEAPYQDVNRRLLAGKAKPCITTSLISAFSDKCEDPDVEESLISFAGTTYAGSDTSVFKMTIFMRAMLLFPEVQVKAQEELDRVVGRDRLPELADKDSLPYISALYKELLRWHPLFPLAFPHKSTVDDWLDGYFIPAGSLIIGSAWATLHDEERYPDPEAFRPERFLTADGKLDPSVPDPVEAFGYGRRICPGRHYADASLFLYIAHILFAFTIRKPLDERGNVVEPPPGFAMSRLFWVPEPFKASIKPRFEGVEELIQLSTQLATSD
uniref:Cytochrome P450 n=1 Tax=Phanerodontia chrysosporium TaxID=2822231 RepID=G5EJR0_PHACH|nr:cytochrome P450 [Phanerodontia chrysosporium]